MKVALIFAIFLNTIAIAKESPSFLAANQNRESSKAIEQRSCSDHRRYHYCTGPRGRQGPDGPEGNMGPVGLQGDPGINGTSTPKNLPVLYRYSTSPISSTGFGNIIPFYSTVATDASVFSVIDNEKFQVLKSGPFLFTLYGLASDLELRVRINSNEQYPKFSIFGGDQLYQQFVYNLNANDVIEIESFYPFNSSNGNDAVNFSLMVRALTEFD